jgi:hypothetical protein
MSNNRLASVAAEEFTFGVEIECAIPSDKFVELGLRTGGYHYGARQDAFVTAGLSEWVIQHDGSLHFRGNFRACEISSPVLQGAEGVAQVVKMVELIKSWGGKVNASCGLHVTVGHEKFREDYTLCQLILSMYRFSDAMVAVGASFGRRSRNYSMSLIHKYGVNVNRKRDGDAAFVNRFMSDRYQALNIRNAKSPAPRVEFRLFAGTLNVNRMLAAIWTSIGICQYAFTVNRLEKAVIDMANYANVRYDQKNVDHALFLFGWEVRKGGKRFFASRLGVMVPASLPANAFEKVLTQVHTDAKRMDEANAQVNFTARVPRPARLTQPRARRSQNGAPSSTDEGE